VERLLDRLDHIWCIVDTNVRTGGLALIRYPDGENRQGTPPTWPSGLPAGIDRSYWLKLANDIASQRDNLEAPMDYTHQSSLFFGPFFDCSGNSVCAGKNTSNRIGLNTRT
jgi:hypothetical protein